MVQKSPSTWNVENIIHELSVDPIIFGFENGVLKVLLYQRAFEPFKDQWGLPGGFVRYDEGIDDACKRILRDFTGLDSVYMEQLRAFGDLGRAKPLGRTITIVYFALVRPGKYKLRPGADASMAKWFDIREMPEMIFDHKHLCEEALLGLRRKVKYEPIGFELLPKKFTLSQLQELYEAIYGASFDKPNFRRKILNMNLLMKLDEKQTQVNHRFASFYKFDRTRYNMLRNKGFYFEM